MSFLRRPDGDNIAKMYGKYMETSDFARLLANQEVKVLCQTGLLTAIVLGFDVYSGVGQLMISKTSEEYCGTFESLYIAQPRKVFKKSLTCPDRTVAVVTAEKKARVEESFSPYPTSFSMNAVSPDATPVLTKNKSTLSTECVVCCADLTNLSDLEREVHISSCLDCSVCVEVNTNSAQECNTDSMDDTQVNWEEYDKKSINDDDLCLICSDNLAGLSEVEKNQHMLRCCLALQDIENGQQSGDGDDRAVDEEKYLFLTQPQPDPQPQYYCEPVPSSCSYSSSAVCPPSTIRDVGVPVVTNSFPASSCSNQGSSSSNRPTNPYRSSYSTPYAAAPTSYQFTAPVINTVPAVPAAPNVMEERGFTCKVFYCVICDLDLSKKQLSNRFQHMKQCAKAHHIDTKVLMSMIAPEGEAGGSLLEEKTAESHHQQGSAGDWKFMMSPQGRPANTTKGTYKGAASTGAAAAAAVVVVEVGGEGEMVPIGAGLDKKGRRKSSSSSSSSTGKKSGATATGAEDTGSSAPTSASTAAAAPTASAKSTSSGAKKSGYWGSSWKKAADKAPNTGYAPAYKKIQIGSMTVPIVVDGFQYACRQLSTCYFLTHFHSDHYMGLEKDFNAGTIYCSATTGALVQMKLRVSAEHLVCLDLEKRYVIEVGGAKVEVTLLEANHCPGAVCILFAFASGKLVLHTGDFRWSGPTLLPLSPTYRALAATAATSNPRNLLVYLDTTYCEAGHNFPPQSSVIDQIVDTVREEARQQPGTLFVFGAYTIGKERVFMAAADELNMKVHVDATRYRTMMTYDWAQREKDKLTTDPSTTWVWVTDMGKINFNQLDTLKKRRPGCRRIVAFSPTGWTHTGGGGGGGGWNGSANKVKKDTSVAAVTAGSVASSASSLHARHKDGNTIYSVSYSEHSSFPELVDFIRTFQPQRVIPTVNCSAEKVKQQVELLRVASGMSATAGSSSSGGDRVAAVQRQVDLKHSEFK